MPRKEGEAVPESSGPAPRQNLGPDQPKLADVYRRFEERLDKQLELMMSYFDQHEKKLNELIEMRGTDQRLTRLEHDARQPCLAIEAERASRYQDSRAHGGRRYCSSSDAWG